MNIINIILDIPEKLVKLTKTLLDFLTYQIDINIELLGIELSFSVWLLLGGVGITTLIIYSVIKS